jgi:hypothetical protein
VKKVTLCEKKGSAAYYIEFFFLILRDLYMLNIVDGIIEKQHVIPISSRSIDVLG